MEPHVAHSDPDPARPSIVRDSLYAERILWSGAPSLVSASSLHRATALLLGAVSAVTTLLAIAASQTGHILTGKLILFAAWTATFGLLVRMIPVIWAQAARFVITDRHVIWQRGTFKRTIQRKGISFARIAWSKKNPRVGDLELVRAVPTGAMNRRLTLALQGVADPDRVWSIARGAKANQQDTGGWDQPIERRLEEGEQVLWEASPHRSLRSLLPLTTRRTLMAALGVLCWMVAVRTVMVAAPISHRLMAAGIEASSVSFLTLLGAMALTGVVLVVVGSWLLHHGITRKVLLDRKTRYLVTDRRVILQRARMEIHVDRGTIVDVADSEGLYGERDAFLVMDGPQARALAAHGAFGPGERVKGFLPMMQSLTEDEVDSLRALLMGAA